MKRRIAAQVLTMCALLTVSGSTAVADRRKLVFPIGHNVSAIPERLAFAYGGRVGLATASIRKESEHYGLLYSFSVPEARIIDDFDLRPDFDLSKPSKLPVMKVHSETGLVMLYGRDSNGIPKLLALSADQAGLLSKLWVVSFPAGSLSASVSGLAFNADGSRIYFIHRYPTSQIASPVAVSAGSLDVPLSAEVHPDIARQEEEDSSFANSSVTAQSRAGSPTLHVALLRAEDGAILATTDLLDAGITGETFFSGWLFFDDARNRAIAMTGRLMHVFAAGSDSIEIETSIDAKHLQVSDLIGKAISKDGRFAVGLYGYRVGDSTTGGGQMLLVSFDLDLKTARAFTINTRFTSDANPWTFHRPTDTLVVPLSLTFKRPNGHRLHEVRGKSRRSIILTFSADGTLIKTSTARIPKRSPDSSAPNIVGSFSSIGISATGALGLLSSESGRVFAFDTSSGEIVNDLAVKANGGLSSIQLLDPPGVIVFNSGRNKLVFADVSTKPIIDAIEVLSDRTIIKGANLLSGARVQIDGVDLSGARRNPDDPGREIIIKRGKRDFPRGQDFTVVVINRDGVSSKPIAFAR
ncbi:MAG: hypothetical protein AABN34_10490 [Acidobacteriota bacterium]